MAVSAESAELNDAATMPIVNSTTTELPSRPEAANMGSSSSPFPGSGSPSFCASIISITPSAMNSRFAGTNASP